MDGNAEEARVARQGCLGDADLFPHVQQRFPGERDRGRHAFADPLGLDADNARTLLVRSTRWMVSSASVMIPSGPAATLR
jgi:hypothetical protein